MKTCKWLAPALLALAPLAAPAPAVADLIVVANRASASLSLIDPGTNQVTTLGLPAGANTPDPMYFTYSPVNNRLFVGDRGNDRVLVYDASSFDVVGSVPTGSGIFHMWGNTLQNQLWVVNDIDRTFTVIDMLTSQVLTTVPMPADLGGTPHDIILDPHAPQVFITVNGLPGLDAVLRFSTDTFQETGRIFPGDNLHVAVAGDNIYVAAQDSNLVAVFDRTTLAPVTTLPVPGAHGAEVSADEGTFYTTNITGGGTNAVFAIDTQTNSILGVADAPFPTPHNVALTPDGSRLYLTHSGATANQVSFYDIGPDGVPVFAGSLTVGNNPFAIAGIPSPVPEPAAWALLLAGGLPLAGALWRRGRKK